MPDRTVLDIVRDVVADIAPEELPDLDFVVRAHTAAPNAARRANRPQSETTASGYLAAGEAVSTFVIAVGYDLCKDMVKYGVQNLGSRAHSRWAFRRRSAVTADTIAPAVAEGDVAVLRDHAAALAAARGADSDRALTVADAVAAKWPRLP